MRGHGRLEAALLIGCETIPVDEQDYASEAEGVADLRCRKLSMAEPLAMLENSAWSARGAGARLFGWHQRSDPRLLQRNDPFGVNHWVGGAVGVVRDLSGGVPKWDELLKCKCDIDATLQELMDNRLVWNEARFCFVQERDKNLGGNSLYRSEDRIATEKRHLKRKWKSHIRMAHRHEADQGATADRRTGMRASHPLTPYAGLVAAKSVPTSSKKLLRA